MEFPVDPALAAHYEHGLEQRRLESPLGRLEFFRTQEILLRHLPVAGAAIADIGGGAGRYTVWLAQQGYRVHLHDVIPLHIEQARNLASDLGVKIDARVGDARALDIEDEAVEAVLALGPLYHLPDKSHRVEALREAYRIVRRGGIVFAAAISRWAPLLHGILVARVGRVHPDALELLDEVLLSGVLPPLSPGDLSGFCHRPDELIAETAEAGLELIDLVGVEGLGFAFGDLDARWSDPEERELLLDGARRIERVPELLGLSPHLLLTARKPS
jgi:SAM-dependent methyltransferase